MTLPITNVYLPPTNVITGTLASATSGASVQMYGNFNISVWGTFVATVVLERSFDSGVTWLPVTFSDGSPVSFTTPSSATWTEPELGVYFRFRASAYTSGTISWRISQ